MQATNGKVYTTVQVARKLGVHKNTVFYWLKTGKVKEPMRDSLFNGRIWTEEDLTELTNMRQKGLISNGKPE
ncbi:MAG: MerR family transcriptional regulator [Candidatus Omnitrophica bacterium]|nr:MerR family transcriptional regulator [Candidatus Omnitrophota bacterium]